MAARLNAFISYSRAEGAATADLVHQLLRAEGLTVWQDRTHMRGGESFWPQIESAIEACDYLILVLSADSFGADRYVLRNEWLTARRRGVPILPVYSRQSIDWKDPKIPPWLLRIHSHDIASPNERARLLNALRSPPVHRVRVPHNVEFPSAFVNRAKEYETLVELLTTAGGSNDGASTVALLGPGGFGKTTLARAVCFDDRVIARFTDGVLWATVGLIKRSPLETLRTLLWTLTDQGIDGLTLEAAQGRWREALRNRHCLVVLDDVWRAVDAQPVLVRESPSVFLLTTRSPVVSDAVDARDCVIKEMTSAEASLLLAKAFESQDVPDGRVVLAHRLGRWPVLLRLAAARLRMALRRHATAEEALAAVETDYEELGITAFDIDNATERDTAVEKVIWASLAFADEGDGRARGRYECLAIVPENVTIPLEALTDLWQCSRTEARRFAEQFDSAGLLEFDFRQGVRVHDVFLRYLRRHVEGLPHRHLDLLTRWGDPLHLPYDYAWRFFGWHCLQAREHRRLFAALTNPDWLTRKLERTDVGRVLADFDHLRSALESTAGDPDDLQASDDRRSLVLLQDAVQKSAHIIRTDRTQLRQQLFGRLRSGMTRTLTRVQEQCGDSSVPLKCLWPSLEPAGSPLTRTMAGHRSAVSHVLVLPGGRAVSTSNDRVLRVWDLETGESFALEGHSDLVFGTTALSDTVVMSWSADATLRLWDLTVQREVSVLRGHGAAVHGVLRLPHDRVLSWSDDGTVRLWDIASGTPRTLVQHEGSIYSVVRHSTNGILSASADSTVWLFDLGTGEGRALRKHSGPVYGVTSLSDQWAISWSEDRTLRAWDLTGGGSRVLDCDAPILGALGISSDEVISWSADGALRSWNVSSGAAPVVLRQTAGVNGVAPLTPGWVISWSDDGMLRVWNLADREGRTLIGHDRRVFGVKVLNDAQALSWSGDRTLRLWDLSSGKNQTLSGHEGPVHGATVVSGSRVLSWSADCTLRLWDLATVAESSRGAHAGWVLGLRLLPGNRALSWSEDGTLRIWEIGTGDSRVLIGHTDWVSGVVAAGPRSALSWSRDASLRVWDLEDGSAQALTGHRTWVNGAAVRGTDGALSWSADGTIWLWDLVNATGTAVLTHDCSIDGVCVASRNTVVAWSSDGLLWVGNPEARQWRQLVGHTDAVRGTMLKPDGTLVSWSDDGALYSWRLDTGTVELIGRHDSPVAGALLLQDGRLLAWAEDGSLCIWSSAAVGPQVLQTHEGAVDGVVPAADGSPVSWSADGTIRIWNVTTGTVRDLTGHENRITGVLPLSGGRVLSWSTDRTVRVWDTSSVRPIGSAYFDAWVTALIPTEADRFVVGDALGRLHVLSLTS